MGHLNLRARSPTEHSAGNADVEPVESVSDKVQGILRAPPAAAVQTEVKACPIVGWRCHGHRRRSAQISRRDWKRCSRKSDCRCCYQQISYHSTTLFQICT